MVKMGKTYLAKSNRANYDDISKARLYLKEIGCEFVEHTGGPYNNQSLLDCHKLLVVPELEDYTIEEDFISIGKGLYYQIESFSQKYSYDNIRILLRDDSFNGKYFFANIKGLELSCEDFNNYIDYGLVIIDLDTLTNYNMITGSDYLKSESYGCELKNHLQTSNNKHLYLLIK